MTSRHLTCLFAAVFLAAGAPAAAQSGLLTGTVTDANTGQPLANGYVYAYNTSGTVIGGGFSQTNVQGVWGISLPAGTYFLKTDNFPAYINEVYDNVNCAP